jgi:hypothetical protein
MSCLPDVPRRIRSLNMENVRTSLIIYGVYWPLQRVDLLVVCTWISQYLNENRALACSPWIDETVGFNTSAVLTL